MQYYSLQHQTLLLPPLTFTIGCCFCFGSISSFFLELFLHWSSVAYWVPTNLGSSSFSVLSFCLFILFMGFSKQEYWSVLPFPSPVDYMLSELSQWHDRLGWPYKARLSFTELDKGVVHVIRLASYLWLWFQSVYPLMPSLSACHLSGVSFTLDVGNLLTTAAPPLVQGVSPLLCRSWPCTWGIYSGTPLLTLDMGYLISAAHSSSTAQSRLYQVQ